MNFFSIFDNLLEIKDYKKPFINQFLDKSNDITSELSKTNESRPIEEISDFMNFIEEHKFNCYDIYQSEDFEKLLKDPRLIEDDLEYYNKLYASQVKEFLKNNRSIEETNKLILEEINNRLM